jgi:hypothetical protein
VEDVLVANPEDMAVPSVPFPAFCSTPTGAAGPLPPIPPGPGPPALAPAGARTHLPSPAAAVVCAHQPSAPRSVLQLDREGTESMQVRRISEAQKEPFGEGQITCDVVVL